MGRLLSVVFAVAPIGFGILRATRTGHDLRMLWMALASSLGGLAARMIARPGTGALTRSAIAFGAATLPAAVMGYLLGARAAAGVWGVAIVFGLSWAAHTALDALARPRAA